jgi:hypothetical protein
MMEMPFSIASRGEPNWTSRPSRTIVPPSRGTTPLTILTRVDFPAPFSPMIAWTSPFWTERLTPVRACTPP